MNLTIIVAVLVLGILAALFVKSAGPQPVQSYDQTGFENEPDCLADDQANYDPASDTEPYGY